MLRLTTILIHHYTYFATLELALFSLTGPTPLGNGGTVERSIVFVAFFILSIYSINRKFMETHSGP